jgi:hypothetical protein
MLWTRFGLAGLLLLAWLGVGTRWVSADPLTPISGGISADNGHLEPIAQFGSVVIFLHEDTHQLTGDIDGDWVEVGFLTLDLATGEGFFMAEGEFTGTVLGESGRATLRVHGEIRDFFVTDRGHFVITQGQGGLTGVHASGTFEYTVGVGGSYAGQAHFDERP